MKKRTFCLAMAAVMVFGLTGCGGAQDWSINCRRSTP